MNENIVKLLLKATDCSNCDKWNTKCAYIETKCLAWKKLYNILENFEEYKNE